MSARRLSQGTSRSIASSGSPFADSAANRLSASNNPNCPILASANHAITHEIRTARQQRLFFEMPPIMTGKRVLRKREVLERLGIRKTTLYESFIKTGRLRFVKIGARAVGVIEDELDVLIEELRRERDRS